MAAKKIKDLKKDTKNFNKHTDNGMEMLRESLKKFGTGRSILLDKNDNIIAGNGVCEAAGDLGIENLIVVESDGKSIIAVKRTDIDIDTREGRELALADNAVGAANLCWDKDKLLEAQRDFGVQPQEWGLLEFGQSEEIDLPDELVGADLTADELEAIQGDGSTEYQRVIIKYGEADTQWLAELLGLEAIDKVVYNIDEL